jgi:polysaccharide biosynthesis protein PslG
MRSLLATLLTTVAATLAVAAPASAVETGINETMNGTLPLGQKAQELGSDWLRIWGTWEMGEPEPGKVSQDYVNWLGAKVDDAEARGIKTLVVIARSPAWGSAGGGMAPPTDPNHYAAYMAELAKRLPAVDAWEIWNEEDGYEFWQGGPDPARYAALLKASYHAIKAVQPHDVVVSGGTVGNNMDFLEQLYAHGAQGSFDAFGVHTDTACNTNDPDFIYRDEKGRVGRYAFTGYREVHAVMSRNGDGAKPIWMTELGWNTQSTAPTSCSVGERKGTKPLGVTEEQQSAFLTKAYRCMAADPFVQTALWFGMQDIPGSIHAGGFGLHRLDGSEKPAAAAFRALDAGIPPDPCGGVVDSSGPEIVVAKPLDGTRFVDMIDIDAKGVDSPGGVGIARIKFYVDGKFERTAGNGEFKISPFWDSRYWKRGKHTLTFKAIDEANNVITKSVTVHKVKKLPRVRTSANLVLEQLDPSTVRVTGGVTWPEAHASTRLRGKAAVVFQKRVKKGKKTKWKTVAKVRRSAVKPVNVTKSLKRGKYRVYLSFPGVEGFKKSRSKPVRFKIAG